MKIPLTIVAQYHPPMKQNHILRLIFDLATVAELVEPSVCSEHRLNKSQALMKAFACCVLRHNSVFSASRLSVSSTQCEIV